MTTSCPECSWPTPTPVSTHGNVRYLRCVCGKWLIEDRSFVVAAAGKSSFAQSRGRLERPHPELGGTPPMNPAARDRLNTGDTYPARKGR